MTRLELSKIASELYKHKIHKEARIEIYKAQEQSSHPKSEIVYDFTKKTQEVIDQTQAKIKAAERKAEIEKKKAKRRRR